MLLIPLNNGDQGCGEKLDYLVSDAWSPAGGEGEEVWGLDEPALLNEALGHELMWAGPVLPREVGAVVVDVDDRLVRDMETYT